MGKNSYYNIVKTDQNGRMTAVANLSYDTFCDYIASNLKLGETLIITVYKSKKELKDLQSSADLSGV